MNRHGVVRHETCEVCYGYGWNESKTLVPVDFDKVTKQICGACGGMGYVISGEYAEILFRQSHPLKSRKDREREMAAARKAFNVGKIEQMPELKPPAKPFRKRA